MQLHLVDLDAAVASALKRAFAPFPQVSVECGDLLAAARGAVVSLANGYGFMDGGIDEAYVRFFGAGVEARVQEAIARRPEGYLPVGASLVVPTGHARIPCLLVVPTMVMPEVVPRENCYRAMRALLRVATREPAIGRDIYCPGLGTGVGGVPPADAAEEMARAYAGWERDQRL